jgi:predicted esterase
VDPARVIAAGFSDGATYALSLGLANGALFQRVMAFSPGFATLEEPEGSPRIFISHGRRDPVLPVEACSRRIVRALREVGYDVTYREFDGAHTVPEEVARDAALWLFEGAKDATSQSVGR